MRPPRPAGSIMLSAMLPLMQHWSVHVASVQSLVICNQLTTKQFQTIAKITTDGMRPASPKALIRQKPVCKADLQHRSKMCQSNTDEGLMNLVYGVSARSTEQSHTNEGLIQLVCVVSAW